MTGQGTANLVTNAINYQVKATVLKGNATTGAVSTQTLADIPLNITGTLSSPAVRPDLEQLAKARLQQELGKHKDELQQKLMDKLKDTTSDMSGSPVMARAPLLLQESLLFPYSDGLSFEHAVLRKGGKEAAFAGVLANPPSSSFEIIHPDAWMAHTPVPVLRLPDIHPLLGDALYGGAPLPSPSGSGAGGEGAPAFFLHAWKLAIDGIETAAPMPENWPRVSDE